MDPLASTESFASYLQRDLDTATAMLALAGASALIRGYCGWSISQETTTMVRDGNGTEVLSLPTLKLNAVTSVTVGGVVLDSDAYEIASRGQLRRPGGAWPYGFANISAYVDHGYAVIPDDVQLVTCSLAARYYTNPDSLRSKASGDDSRVYAAVIINSDFAELAMQLLAAYRLGGV